MFDWLARLFGKKTPASARPIDRLRTLASGVNTAGPPQPATRPCGGPCKAESPRAVAAPGSTPDPLTDISSPIHPLNPLNPITDPFGVYHHPSPPPPDVSSYSPPDTSSGSSWTDTGSSGMSGGFDGGGGW